MAGQEVMEAAEENGAAAMEVAGANDAAMMVHQKKVAATPASLRCRSGSSEALPAPLWH